MKRKRNGDFIEYIPPSPEQPQASMSQQADPSTTMSEATQPPTKKKRITRSSKVTNTEPKTPKPPAVKNTRASRAKKAPAQASTQPTTAAPSTPPEAGPSQPAAPPPRKRGRKKAVSDADASGSGPEKRGAVFKPTCPQNILDRVQRVMTQRIFMIDRNRIPGELREEFSVLGSTGNVYTVTIDHKPRCNCPDACMGNHCKHILFIFLKVLHVDQAAGSWYQKALLTSELEVIFAQAPLAPNSIAHPHIREAHARATGKAPMINVAEEGSSSGSKNRRIPGPDDDCPICYDGMHGVAEASLVFCEECGNALHKECFQQWKGTSTKNGKELTCVWCRARWVVPSGPAGAIKVKKSPGVINRYNRYLNLSEVATG